MRTLLTKSQSYPPASKTKSNKMIKSLSQHKWFHTYFSTILFLVELTSTSLKHLLILEFLPFMEKAHKFLTFIMKKSIRINVMKKRNWELSCTEGSSCTTKFKVSTKSSIKMTLSGNMESILFRLILQIIEMSKSNLLMTRLPFSGSRKGIMKSFSKSPWSVVSKNNLKNFNLILNSVGLKNLLENPEFHF